MDPRRLGAELYAHDPSVQELLTLKAFEVGQWLWLPILCETEAIPTGQVRDQGLPYIHI
jgi:hypothetical protein